MLKPLIWSITNVKVHGKERLAGFDGPYIVASNHTSHLDCPLIIGALPRRLSKNLAAGAAADYFFDHWWRAAPTSLFFNAFPVDRGVGRGRRGMAGQLLSDGVPLLLFPEGTRSRDRVMGKFKPGVASLCISRNVPCLPVAIVGAGLAMPSGTSWPRNGRPPVHVVFGEPMYPGPGENAHQFSDRIAAQIRDLHDTTALAVGLPRLTDYERERLERTAKDSHEGADALTELPPPLDSANEIHGPGEAQPNMRHQPSATEPEPGADAEEPAGGVATPDDAPHDASPEASDDWKEDR